MQQLPDAVAGMLRLLDVLQRSALVRTTRCAFVLQLGAKQLFGLTKGPTGVFKSVLDTTRTDGKRRDEIYVDVVERLSMTFNAAGNPISCQIDGAIQVGVMTGTSGARPAGLVHCCLAVCCSLWWRWWLHHTTCAVYRLRATLLETLLSKSS